MPGRKAPPDWRPRAIALLRCAAGCGSVHRAAGQLGERRPQLIEETIRIAEATAAQLIRELGRVDYREACQVAADQLDAPTRATIGLISCSARKLGQPAPARELYTSPLFRQSLAYAEERCEHVYVLSARHRLVELDQVIAPYEQRLGSATEREQWGAAVAAELVARHGGNIAALMLAGVEYADAIRLGWVSMEDVGAGELYIVDPLARKQIGERLRWLRDPTPG